MYGPIDWKGSSISEGLPRIDNDGGGVLPQNQLLHLLEPLRPCGRGALWTVYRSRAQVPGVDSDLKIAVKFSSSRTIAASENTSNPYSWGEARAAIKRDIDVMMGPLAHLQSHAVPSVYGIYVSAVRQQKRDEETWAMILSDGGERVDIGRLQLHERRVILQHYQAIHDAQVLHWDCHPRNWLRSIDPRRVFESKLLVTDFERSFTRDEVIGMGWNWESACEEEMQLVRKMLSLQ
ncbi:hypothetical protein BCR39DRAFT_552867 [Naematelia encephala]|uniref:Protein kinase domain-containing protein n=1 Tax=Naematelia encephala TaxID=71784 RepID=A0A1Y2AHN8_9TREE|nr:hypothetical protein BCR39DRAFT_552867 [Naematelia encephala]